MNAGRGDLDRLLRPFPSNVKPVTRLPVLQSAEAEFRGALEFARLGVGVDETRVSRGRSVALEPKKLHRGSPGPPVATGLEDCEVLFCDAVFDADENNPALGQRISC